MNDTITQTNPKLKMCKLRLLIATPVSADLNAIAVTIIKKAITMNPPPITAVVWVTLLRMVNALFIATHYTDLAKKVKGQVRFSSPS